ncbi:hypothetical protein GOBAR_AA08864 [Gossypium barbadense]|uniref:RRM domain-containing protein n=1 Tax=Gossypium barbadense TaxID=3634 RepID=A0A2P5Y8B5_GOSBA|nr:hypothetical protein GOBAR_AA08864 [Gossypium barbadense]
MENGIVTTVFVYNIAFSMHWKGLWALFGYHGDVVDAFIPLKRCRNGNMFGFVRFNNERDAQRAILRLNGFSLMGMRIGVKMARYNGRRKIWQNDSGQKFQEQSIEIVKEAKNEESLEKNAGGVKNTEKRIVQGHVEDEIRIQGRHFLVEISDEELVDLLRQTEWSYLKDFFIKIELWSENLKIKERVTWIEVSGVPLHCWNYETFSRVAGLWGKLVSIGENLTKVHNFEKMELLISLTQSNMARWKKTEEDSISESESVARSRPEVPLEGRENVKSGELIDTNIENGNNINERQQILELVINETKSEHVSKELKKGSAVEADKGLEKALKDVRDMGLDIVKDTLEDPKAGGVANGSNLGVGCRKVGISKLVENISPVEGIMNSQDNETVKEEELNQMILRRKKKKGLNKKIRSMHEIQNSFLTSKERKKRNRALNKEKGREYRKDNERVVNLSVSDSDLRNWGSVCKDRGGLVLFRIFLLGLVSIQYSRGWLECGGGWWEVKGMVSVYFLDGGTEEVLERVILMAIIMVAVKDAVARG